MSQDDFLDDRRRASEDDYFADGMADQIRGKLTSLPGLQVIARGSSTPYKKTNKTPKQIDEELNASDVHLVFAARPAAWWTTPDTGDGGRFATRRTAE